MHTRTDPHLEEEEEQDEEDEELTELIEDLKGDKDKD